MAPPVLAAPASVEPSSALGSGAPGGGACAGVGSTNPLSAFTGPPTFLAPELLGLCEAHKVSLRVRCLLLDYGLHTTDRLCAMGDSMAEVRSFLDLMGPDLGVGPERADIYLGLGALWGGAQTLRAARRAATLPAAAPAALAPADPAQRKKYRARPNKRARPDEPTHTGSAGHPYAGKGTQLLRPKSGGKPTLPGYKGMAGQKGKGAGKFSGRF